MKKNDMKPMIIINGKPLEEISSQANRATSSTADISPNTKSMVETSLSRLSKRVVEAKKEIDDYCKKGGQE